jgi:hypothetical protein
MSSADPGGIDVMVSEFIQKGLKRRGLSSVNAAEAAGWLDPAVSSLSAPGRNQYIRREGVRITDGRGRRGGQDAL